MVPCSRDSFPRSRDRLHLSPSVSLSVSYFRPKWAAVFCFHLSLLLHPQLLLLLLLLLFFFVPLFRPRLLRPFQDAHLLQSGFLPSPPGRAWKMNCPDVGPKTGWEGYKEIPPRKREMNRREGGGGGWFRKLEGWNGGVSCLGGFLCWTGNLGRW